MTNPKISVIVPIYKAEKYIRLCIDSILAQTLTDFEVLLVDDGSPDSCGTICDEYANKDSRVRVFHKENGGVSSARNFGLREAKGIWVFFADADDELLPNAFDVFLDMIDDKYDMLMMGYVKIDESGDNYYSVNKQVERVLTPEESIMEMFKPSDYIYMGYLFTKLFKMDIIRSHNISFKENIFYNEDRLFSIEYLCKCKKITRYTTVPVYKYVIHEGSAMSAVSKSFNYKFVTDFDAFVLMYKIIKKNYHHSSIREEASNALWRSYLQQLSRMNEFQVKDMVLKKHLRKNVAYSIPRLFFNYYLKLLMRWHICII